MRKAILFALGFVLSAALPRLPFDNMPPHINTIVSRDGHSVPHRLEWMEGHEEHPQTQNGTKSITVRLEKQEAKIPASRYTTVPAAPIKDLKPRSWYDGKATTT